MRAGISFPYLRPLSVLTSVGAYRPLFPSPQSGFFFCQFPRRVGCNPATPIIAHKGGGGNQARREQGGRRTSCYICNVFAFTIFQLVCILEPLLLASTLVPSIFSFSPPLPSSSLLEPPLVDAALYVFSAFWTIVLAAQ